MKSIKKKLSLLALSAVLYGPMYGPNRKPDDPQKIELERIISTIERHGSIVHRANIESCDKLCIIFGMYHQSRYEKNVSAKDRNTIGMVFADIYGCLGELVERHNLRLVIGEGLGEGELTLSYEQKGITEKEAYHHRNELNKKENASRFFSLNLKEPPYAIIELLYPHVDTYGFAEPETKTEDMLYNNPLLPKEQRRIVLESLCESRSISAAQTGAKIAQTSQKHTVYAIVMGEAHAAQIVRYYQIQRGKKENKQYDVGVLVVKPASWKYTGLPFREK